MGLIWGSKREYRQTTPDFVQHQSTITIPAHRVETGSGRQGEVAAFPAAKAPGPTAADSSRLRLDHRPLPDHTWAVHVALFGRKFDNCEFAPAEYVRDAYIDECERRHWWPRAWNVVAGQYRRAYCGGRKTYRGTVAGYLVPARQGLMGSGIVDPPDVNAEQPLRRATG